MRRATLTWRKVAPEIEVVPTPVPESQFYAHTRGASLEQIRGILHEYAALASLLVEELDLMILQSSAFLICAASAAK